MSVLLDFERVLEEADLYAYRNWLLGELVQGPNVGRYSCKCVFMWPYKLMPDPSGALRLHSIGCKVVFGKSHIEVPIEVKDYDDFVQGTRYPKMHERKVWFVEITIPIELMNDIKEGSIDLADSNIDLSDIDEAYNEDLDKLNQDPDGQNSTDNEGQQQQQSPQAPPSQMGGLAPGGPQG